MLNTKASEEIIMEFRLTKNMLKYLKAVYSDVWKPKYYVVEEIFENLWIFVCTIVGLEFS